MYKQKLVLIGNGMAGLRCVESIISMDPTAFEITIFGSEPHVNYNRILLSTVLQGNTSFEDIAINDRDWYTKNNIQLFTGETVVKIDKETQKIITDKEREVHYDKLIIATGSSPFILPVTGVDKEGVIAFRTIEDCQKMIDTSRKYKKAVVIGGGLLGLEAARGLLNLGMEVNVVHIADHLMERQLDSTASLLLQKELENQGMNFLLKKETQEIIGNDRVERVRFKDGTELEADLVVMAAGVRPNIQLAKESGIDTNRAIIVNDYLETSIPNIFAVGECVEHHGIVYGLVKPLYEQGEVLAKHICEMKCNGYQGSVLSTQLKISGVELFSVGDFLGDETTKSITTFDELDGVYKKVVFQGRKIIGAVLYGDTKVSSRLLDMILKRQVVSSEEKHVLFQSPSTAEGLIASMANHEIICNCNAVSKGAIIGAVRNKGLTTVEQVKQCTKASGSCGGCKPAVTELLAYILGNLSDQANEQTVLCSCTTLTEDEVVYKMQLQDLTSVQEVMDVLGWENTGGCSTCRPALSYYLGMIHPEYEIRQQTLFINEQKNATVQSDDRYSVIPQMYGGMTNAKDLRKIANVADKYDISQVAVTSEQRIHLMGVKKEDLPGVWADLDMPLSSKYGNTVQNVKTCIGEHVCSCDKKQSLLLAVDLEKRLEHVSTPYRLKMGISACMHNGAGSTTKDIGVMGIDRGWEIYVGGSSGRNVRAGELLCVAGTNEEAIEIIISFIQYYRETANYLERTWEWIERVGLIHVREVLFDNDLSQQLSQRLEMAYVR
ncbi:nitrite reductase (NADH) large subunit [Peribacillus simplex]|uniref:Nitrite reductase (NADH) large subunit n=1 Tax=Peribacillus simplex TaxID=1478 RepID=A0A9X8WLM2_9BACI|nr:nitrite reductase large subunit NirB [Peribacillus simplex]SIR72052.1 nitrite reductase (NADH) large subunit [Peribacillus simplex]